MKTNGVGKSSTSLYGWG